MRLSTILSLSAALLACALGTHAQGTAFTYQGRLNNGAAPANGVYDFRFRLAYDSLGNSYAAGGTAVFANATPVSNGLFTATVDFGAGVFTGTNLFLEVGVRTNGGSTFTTLNPFQPLTSTPYAITASNITGTVFASQLSGTIASSGLAGTYSAPLTFNNAANSFSGNGAGLANVNALTLTGLGASSFWQLNGNNVAPGQFLGSTNNQPLEFYANAQRVLRLEPTTNAPNIVGGWSNNFVAPGVVNATIAGGGGQSVANGSLLTNAIYGAYGTIAGGVGNVAGNATNSDVVASRGATVGGGVQNTASGLDSTIPGGNENLASGLLSFAAGQGSQAIHNGAFVWTDSQGGFFASTTNDEFNIRSFNGVRIQTDKGIHLDAADRPMIVRDWDVFSTNAPSSKVGIGRWGMFMEPDMLVLGIPSNDVAPRWFQIAKYSTNGNRSALLTLDQSGNVTIPGFFIGGSGFGNVNNGGLSVISGGESNLLYSSESVIAGGFDNFIDHYGNGNVIGGGYQNSILSNCYEATIAGGFTNTVGTNAYDATIGGGNANNALAPQSTISGGSENTTTPAARFGTISGGSKNIETQGYTFIGGGYSNLANGYLSFIGGGEYNTTYGFLSGIVCGIDNTNYGYQSFIGGGVSNIVGGTAATVAGGTYNQAYGLNSFAAGEQAAAYNDNTFVWSDGQYYPFYSVTSNEFAIRAQNGVRITSDIGIHLNAADEPLIVRDWDTFGTNAPAWKAGIGRWGLFMEPTYLTLGIPDDIPGRYFQVAKYDTNGGYTQLMQVDQNGTVTANALSLPSGTDVIYSGSSTLLFNYNPNHSIYLGTGAGNGSFAGANTALGYQAMNKLASGFDNTAVGDQAMVSFQTGGYNAVLGNAAMGTLTNGSFNTAIGDGALINTANSSNNIAVGYFAGSNIGTGSNNICIGNNGAFADTNTVRIGNAQTKTFIAGISGATAASGVAVYVNTSGQLGTLTSSAKYKKEIKEMSDASEALYSLKPVTFKYKDELDPHGTPQFGLVAEQVEKVDPDLVAHDDKGQIYTVRYQAVDAMLLNEFLKEHKKVQDQDAKLSEQEAEIKALKDSLQQLQQTVANLTK